MGKIKPNPIVDAVTANKSIVAQKIDTVIINEAAPARTADPRQKPPRNIPEKYDKFAGRERELAEIHQRLCKKSSLGVTQQTAAHGHGGVGKTSIALEYAWRHLDDYPGGLFVLLCDRDLLFPAVVDLAVHLDLPKADTPEQTALSVKAHLESGESSLLILDNVRNAKQWLDHEWTQYLPAGNCRRLITTHAARLPGVDMYPIERLTPDDGVDLIAQFRPDAKDAANRDTVAAIVEWLDGWAVALTVVGVYMSINSDLSWADYRTSLEKKGLGAIRSTEDRVHEQGGLPDRYAKRIDAIWDETVDTLSPQQRRAVEFAALLPEETVLIGWLSWLLSNDKDVKPSDCPGYESDPYRPVVDQLLLHRLLRLTEPGTDKLVLHRVLRLRLRERVSSDPHRRHALWGTLVELAEHRGKDCRDAVRVKSLRAELSPLLGLSQVLLEEGWQLAAASLANQIHTPLEQLGRYREDLASLERFVSDGRCVIERDDPVEAADLLCYLGIVRYDLTDLDGAEQVLRRAVTIYESTLELNHPSLAAAYSELALVLEQRGDLVAAERLARRALKILEVSPANEASTLGIRCSNLAMLLHATWERDPQNIGRLSESRGLMERAIAIHEGLPNPDKLSLATDYSNYSLILRELNNLKQARRFAERAITLMKDVLGTDHPDLATAYHTLAYVEVRDGNKTRACQLWQEAREILSKHFEPSHPRIAHIEKYLNEHSCSKPTG